MIPRVRAKLRPLRAALRGRPKIRIRPGPHSRDIPEADLQLLRGLTEYPDNLDELVRTARRRLGFFPAHSPRTVEYPWILAQVRALPRGSHVLEVGSGVNPLPLVLAKDGYRMETVDPHPAIRAAQPPEEWNEWGFLDYHLLDRRIQSHHLGYEAFEPREKFDCIYSVSVVEHVPTETRRGWAKRFAEQLRPGGLLLLTLDLVLGTDDLWNLAEGKAVESAAVHGTSHDVCRELEQEGFTVGSRRTYHEIPDSGIGTEILSARNAA